jgi:hypothetical protein
VISAMSFVMLLTASINPRGMTLLKVTDPGERRRQYERSLRYLLSRPCPQISGVVFVENTGADLGEFRAAAREYAGTETEFLSLDLNDYPRALGKGYGEFQMLDRAMETSRLVRSANYLAKLTGRLRLGNLCSILGALPREFDLAADIEEERPGVPGFFNSRLIVFTPAVYEQKIKGLYERMNDSTADYAEYVLFRMARENPQLRIIGMLPREPKWLGVAGTSGERYDSLRQRLKYPYKALRRAWRLMRGGTDAWRDRGGY